MPISNPELDLSPILPGTVTVRFPTRVCPGPCVPPGGQAPPKWYISTTALATATGTLLRASGTVFVGSPGTYVVHDNCIATYDGVTSLPTNKTKLDAIAVQIAHDFYNWRSLAYDLVYNGITSPTLDASIDTLEITYAVDEDTAPSTRFTSAPWNGEPEEFFHNDISCVYPTPVVYVPTASRVGGFLRMPKAKLTETAQGELLLCTSSYDDIFLCATSSHALMAMRPDFTNMMAGTRPVQDSQQIALAVQRTNLPTDIVEEADMGHATTLPPYPTLCNGNGDTVDLRNHFAGRTAFLLGGGPSLTKDILKNLEKSGIITLALNNVSELIKPTMWTAVDDPAKFPQGIFNDPEVLKFLPRCFAARTLTEDRIVDDFPSTLYFRRNGHFNSESFLTEPTFNWGCQQGISDSDGYLGGRSVMLPALKLLYYFGCFRVILLGCDFRMGQEKPYAHSEAKGPEAVESNNRKYRILDARFHQLRPVFDAANFTVLNGTLGSHLTAFDFVDYRKVLEECEKEQDFISLTPASRSIRELHHV